MTARKAVIYIVSLLALVYFLFYCVLVRRSLLDPMSAKFAPMYVEYPVRADSATPSLRERINNSLIVLFSPVHVLDVRCRKGYWSTQPI